MSSNKYLGYDECECDGKTYTFKVDYNFLAELKEYGSTDCMVIYNAFCAGEADPVYIRNVLICSIRTIENSAVNDSDKQQVCEDLITLNGLQEAWMLAQHLLAYSMIGSIKKYLLRKQENIQEIVNSLSPFRFANLKNQLLLWVYLLLISGVCACINFKLFGMLGAWLKG